MKKDSQSDTGTLKSTFFDSAMFCGTFIVGIS